MAATPSVKRRNYSLAHIGQLASGTGDAITDDVLLQQIFHGRGGTVIRYFVSIAVLGWLAFQVEWHHFATLPELDWKLGAAAIFIAGLAYPLQAWRWQVLLRAQGLPARSRPVHGIFWIGQFYNSFLPGGIAGDAYRAIWLWRLAPRRKADIAANLLADRLLGLGALFALASAALATELGSGGRNETLQHLLGASLAACCLLGVMGYVVTQTRGIEELLRRFFGEVRTRNLQEAALTLGGKHSALTASIALSVGVWLADFLALWLLAQSLALEISPLKMSVAAAAAYVAAALPISVGGHGVREATLVATLAILGLDTNGSAMAAFALTVWVLSVGWSLLGGLYYLSSLVWGWPLERREISMLSKSSKQGSAS